MSNRTTPTPEPNGLATVDQSSTLARVNEYLATRPTVQDDPTETMLAAILESENPSEWEAVFTAQSFKGSDKAKVQINAYRPAESRFEGGLKYFLVLDVTDLETGVKGVMTCGSTMAIAQILNAERTDHLPIKVEIVRKDKPTKNGFFPMRLRFLDRERTPLGDPTAVVSEQ